MTRFDVICAQLRTLKAAGLQHTDSYSRLCDLALQCAPDEVMAGIMTDAVREGLLPPPMGFDAQGERLWDLRTIAAHFGLSEAEARKSLDAFRLEHGDIPDIQLVHRIH